MTKPLILFISILIYSCQNAEINDPDKRNENWVYWVDSSTGESSWIPVSDQTTVKDGKYTSFYNKGSVFEKGKLKNGKHIDTIYCYGLDENLIKYQYIIKSDTLDYYIKDGAYTAYYKNRKKFEKGTVKNHKIGNVWTKYFKNGNVRWTQNLIDRTGITRWYYENGQISDSIYHFMGKTHGQIKLWFENGQIKEISNWNHGIQNGLYESFYENGKPEGKEESWYTNGYKKNIKFFKNGLLDGNLKQWYPNGKMQLDVNHSLGQKNGKATLYYENGNLQVEQFYKNEKRDGICLWYDKNGKLIKKESYINGQVATVEKSPQLKNPPIN